MEPAMDFEATSGQHALRLTVVPLQDRAAVLRQAIRALRPHLRVGPIWCHSLIVLGLGVVNAVLTLGVWDLHPGILFDRKLPYFGLISGKLLICKFFPNDLSLEPVKLF